MGRPCRGLLLTARDGFLIPFSLLWGGFAIVLEVAAWRGAGGLFVQLWGMPFVLIGLYLIVGRFILDAWLRDQTRYAVTNRRILIARLGAFGKLTSLRLDRLPQVQLNEKRDGSGTLWFGIQTDRFWGWGHTSPNARPPALDLTPQFIGIANAQNVFQLIQRAIRDAAEG